MSQTDGQTDRRSTFHKTSLRRVLKNQLSTRYNTQPYEVVGRKGSSFTLRKNGNPYKRHVKHTKKVTVTQFDFPSTDEEFSDIETSESNNASEVEVGYRNGIVGLNPDNQNNDIDEELEHDNNQLEPEPSVRRSSRTTKQPERFKDFQLHSLIQKRRGVFPLI